MLERRLLYRSMVAIVRPCSLIAVVAQTLALAVTSSGAVAITWKFGFGLSFFRGLSEWSALLAVGCMFICFPLVLARKWCGTATPQDVRWCIWINVLTMVLFFFVPARSGI